MESLNVRQDDVDGKKKTGYWNLCYFKLYMSDRDKVTEKKCGIRDPPSLQYMGGYCINHPPSLFSLLLPLLDTLADTWSGAVYLAFK